MEENKPRGVSLSPKSMVDSVADWPLHRVVEHLRKKEKEEKDRRYEDCHVTGRYAVRMLTDTVDGLAGRYEVTRARMSRWISHQALAILREDLSVGKLLTLCSSIRSKALDGADADTLAIMGSLTAYRATNLAECSVSLYLYEPWMKAEFQEKATICGVRVFPLVQLFFMRSILTIDFEGFAGVLEVFQYESDRWDTWVKHRLGMLEKLSTGEIWGLGGPPPRPVVVR